MVFTITVWFTVDHYFLIIMSSYSLVYYLVEMITITLSLCRTIVIGMITFCDPCRLNIIMDYDCVLYNIAVYQLSVRVSILPTLKNSCITKLFHLEGTYWSIKLVVTMQHFIEVPVPRKLSCYVFGCLGYQFYLSLRFCYSILVGTVPTVWYLCVFLIFEGQIWLSCLDLFTILFRPFGYPA